MYSTRQMFNILGYTGHMDLLEEGGNQFDLEINNITLRPTTTQEGNLKLPRIGLKSFNI